MFMKFRKKSKKAQSGMEYLMTYGWAVLVVGIIVLLLLSLRVLDVDWWSVKNEVWMLSSFGIPDFKASPYTPSPSTTSVLIFQLINNRGTNVTVNDITMDDIQVGSLGGGIYVWDCPTPSTCYLNSTTFPFNMTPGKRLIVNGTISVPGEVNTVFTSKVQIKYTSPRSTLEHRETGMMRGRIEPTG